MKIVILSDDFPPKSYGGAGIVAFEQARELVRVGHEVVVITTTQEAEDAGRILFEGMAVHRLYTKYHERFRAYRSLYNPQVVALVKMILGEVHPDVVHAHNIHYYLSYHCLKLAKQGGASVFMTAHDVMLFHYGKLVEFIDHDDLSCPKEFNYKISPFQQLAKYKKRYNPFRNIIIKYYLQYVDRIFAVSEALKEALRQNGIMNVVVVNNGVDVDAWQSQDSDIELFKKGHDLNSKKIILFGGRLSAAKGGHQALLALEQVIKSVPNAVLLIMGGQNAYTNEVQNVAREKGIEDHLVFTGWIAGADLRAAYHACDILVMPSMCFDTFGMVCLEAMACKKAVIATCFGGPREVVVDGVTGYIVNPLNIAHFSEKIVDLLTNSSEAQAFGEAGYARAKKFFSLSEKVKECVAIYDEVLNKKNGK